MSYFNRLTRWTLALAICLFFVLPCSAQFREYYIHGKIVDSANKPLEKVEIKIRDIKTSRSYSRKTNKKGVFKFVGIPHGVYKAVISKKGYKTWEIDWRFNQTQTRMQKVEVKTIIMVTEEQMANAKLSKKLQKLMDSAKTAIGKNDIDGAIPLLQQMLTEKADDPNALYLLGICYLKKEKLDLKEKKVSSLLSRLN